MLPTAVRDHSCAASHIVRSVAWQAVLMARDSDSLESTSCAKPSVASCAR